MKETQEINGKNQDNPTEKLLEQIEVKEVQAVEPNKKKGGVTAKTLSAIRTQMQRIEDNELISIEDAKKMKEIMAKVRNEWINKTL